MQNIKTMKACIPFLFFCLLAGKTVQAQRTVSLDSVLATIERNNPVVRVYDADIRAADEAAKGAKAWEPPQLGAGLWMTPYNLNLVNDGMDRRMGSFMLSAQQMIPNRKEQQANAAYLGALSSVNKENRFFSLNSLYASAKENYFSWLIAKKKLVVLDENEKLLRFMIESAELRYKNNLGKLGAYYKAKAALGKIENQRVVVLNDITQKRIVLNTLMNRPKTEEFSIDTGYAVKTYGWIDTSYLSTARSDIRALTQQGAINQFQLALEQTKLKPQFGVQYNHMFAFGNNPWLFSLMGTVKIPLAPWSAGSYRATVESLRWKSQSYEAQKQTVLNEATGQANGLIAGLKSKQKQVRLYEEQILPALQRNFKAAQLSYEQNTGELFELFDAWESLNMTQLDYLDQLQEFLNLQVVLERILEQK